MAVIYKQGDLTLDDADVLINPVNCIGVMGAGLAAAFKQRWPDYFTSYQRSCRQGNLSIGKLHAYIYNNQTLLSFPTKDHFLKDSELYYIQVGLKALEAYLKDYTTNSIAIPKLGCGKGGLKWTVVHPLIIQTANRFPNIEFRIYGEQL